MGSNHAQTRQNTEEIENKLDSILKAVESQHGFSKKNFVIMKKLVFLWVIGENAQIEELLKTEIKSIVEDSQTVWIIHSKPEEIAENIYDRFYDGINFASHNYLNVDMDNLMICPVLLPGCFEQEGSEMNFIQAALYVESELEGHRRHPQWSPFILTSDENIELTGRQLRVAASFMDEIMQEGRKYNQDCCCPGCIISDVNEVGQAISLEQKAKIIVLLTVFRNTECENGESVNTVMLPIAKGEKECFFTARAISICEPVKSLMLNRLLAVHSYFREGRFPQDKLFDNLRNTFFEGSIWKEHLDKLPHDEKYNILTAPVYSNIPLPDAKEYQKSLEDFSERYYFAPLRENEAELIEQWWKSFFEEFFMQLAGSVESLDAVEENREKILDKVPPLNVKTAGAVYVNDLRRSCEGWLAGELKGYQKKLAENSIKPDGRYMQRFRENKETLKDILQNMESLIRSRIRRLRQTELLLNTGGGHIANPQDEAEHWMQEYTNNDPKKVTEIYREYQRILCEMFQKNIGNANITGTLLLDNYSKIVSGSIESRESYMKTKLANLAGSDMEQLISKLGESWLYPVRLIGSVDQNKNQRLYIMGNKENYLCRKMLEQPNYQVAFKECALDDRLEIVRVSDKLTKRQIFTQEQESDESGQSL